MKTYDETMNDYLEVTSLGYSAREAVESLQDDEDANEEALKQLQNALKYGI